MNKKLLMPIALTILLLGTAFVYAAQNWATEVGPVKIEKGWNLVYGFLDPAQLEGQALASSHIKAIYGFIPQNQEYLRLYPNPVEKQKAIDQLSQQAFWVYSDEAMSTEYWLYNLPQSSERSLLTGWNFVGITPDMIGKTLNELKGDCTYSAIYSYGTEGGITGWGDLLNNPNFVDKEAFETGNVGIGLVIKVPSSCTFGVSTEEITNPPTLP